MFLDATEPIEILHYAYENARIFPIDFPTNIVVLCHYLKLIHVYSYGYLVPSEYGFLFLKIMIIFGIDNVVVPLIFSFFYYQFELHQKFCTMALVTR
jgi:hypothetical protein